MCWEERQFQLPANIWLSTLEKAIARHIKLPRSALQGAPGSQHPTFSIDNSPLELVRLKCESAGLKQEGETTRDGMRVTSKAVPPYWYTCHMFPYYLPIFIPTIYLPLRDILPPHG